MVGTELKIEKAEATRSPGGLHNKIPELYSITRAVNYMQNRAVNVISLRWTRVCGVSS